MEGIPHYLLDVTSPKRTFTVNQYQKLAKKALKKIIKKGKLPIICGGTGLYIDTLIYDYQLPQVPPQPKLRKQLEKKSTEELFGQLQKLDSRRAQNIDKHNRRRLIRALEIILITKKPITPLTTARRSNNNDQYQILKIGINLPKEKLQRKIRKRIKQMLKNGLLKEIKNLKKQKLSWGKIYRFGFEYKYPAMFLQNKISKDEIIDNMIKENWRYAKRQLTWFKRDKNINWIINEKEAAKLTNKFIKN